MRKLLNWLRSAHMVYVASPAGERVVYREIQRRQTRKILEVGVGGGRRTLRMIEAAMRGAAGRVCYAGVDLFEMRSPSDDRLTLKQAHALLKPSGARVRLIPGDPFTALARMANEIGPCDLIVIAGDQPEESLERAWFYVPRLLHAGTVVFSHGPGAADSAGGFAMVSHEEIRCWAARSGARRRAA
ncbi:MAG: class I SAM-dependent methyltransferase [Candidatus Saccharimonadales bacterium]